MLMVGVAAQRQTPSAKVVRGSDDLQAALNLGGAIELESDATFSAARFVVRKSGTTVRGHSASLRSASGLALYIPPAINDVSVSDLSLTSDAANAVVQCGDNGAAQTQPEQQPRDITFRNVTIPTHRGRRGVEINCAAAIVGSNGNAIVQSDRPAGSPQGPLTIKNSRMTVGTYGVATNGSNFGEPLPASSR
jgi:hypothetical protein